MVVGLVDIEGAHEVVEGGADELLELFILEVWHIELEAFDVGEAEVELLVGEVGVLDREDEAADGDAAGEVERAVLAHGHQAPHGRVGVDHHGLAVGDHKLVDASDVELAVGEVEAGIGAGGRRLE